MGQEVGNRDYVEEREFIKRLRDETRHVARLYKDDRFQRFEKPTLGAEVEAWLVDRDHMPAARNAEFLDALGEELATTELAQFNFELNLDPVHLNGGFPSLKDQIETLWADCHAVGEGMDLTPALIGILPTLRNDMLSPQTMTPSQRYEALNERVMELRGAPTEIDIARRESLKMAQNHLMIEAACTSLQTHLTVNPGEDEARFYNAAQIASAPLVAISANSPYLYGKCLWDETRIPAFEQALGLQSFRSRDGLKIGRVTFGTHWLRHSLMELFLENLDCYEVLLPILEDADPEALTHFKLQNGTLWRWNRPIVGGDASGPTPHLRIENRVTPAGPTIYDMVANAAFFVGLTLHIAKLETPPEERLRFITARSNFYSCAMEGLGANITWLDDQVVNVQDLIFNTLTDQAEAALVEAGVPAMEAQHYIKPIRGRAKTGMTGAKWQRAFVNCHGRDFQHLVAAYLEQQAKGRPVHTWRI